eukprot:431731_1
MAPFFWTHNLHHDHVNSQQSQARISELNINAPPADAFTITGYPTSFATATHSSASAITRLSPGITFTPAAIAVSLDRILSPIDKIEMH